MNKKNNGMSAGRRLWNRLIPALVWIAAIFAVALTTGIILVVLCKGLPNLSWSLLTSVPSVIRGIGGILP